MSTSRAHDTVSQRLRECSERMGREAGSNREEAAGKEGEVMEEEVREERRVKRGATETIGETNS